MNRDYHKHLSEALRDEAVKLRAARRSFDAYIVEMAAAVLAPPQITAAGKVERVG